MQLYNRSLDDDTVRTIFQYTDYANQLNSCGVECETMQTREVFLHLALVMAHSTTHAAKNLGFALEHFNRPHTAAALYTQMLKLYPRDAGMRLHLASTCPAAFGSVTEARYWYVSVMGQLAQILHGSADMFLGDFMMEITSLPLAWPYMGFCLEPLHNALADALVRIAGEVFGDTNYAPVKPSVEEPRPRSKPRICVLSEHDGNSSPGLLLQVPDIASLQARRCIVLATVCIAEHRR
jgi:hypothetical protein